MVIVIRRIMTSFRWWWRMGYMGHMDHMDHMGHMGLFGEKQFMISATSTVHESSK